MVGLHNERRINPKNSNKGKNGGGKDKRKTDNDGQDAEARVAASRSGKRAGKHSEWRHWTYRADKEDRKEKRRKPMMA